jgi:hypothetical protein
MYQPPNLTSPAYKSPVIMGVALSVPRNCRCPRPPSVAIIPPSHAASRDVVYTCKEASAVMRSSASTTFRAFLMLVCTIGVPALAMWGASWSDILKKFQNFRWPAIVELASASTPAPALTEAPHFAPRVPMAVPQPQSAPPTAPTLAINMPQSGPSPVGNVGGASDVPSDFRDIRERLQQLGATYYVLESWGNGQELYRFYCRMAVDGNADYTHCFEATNADPRQAMQEVLRQVESWRETAGVGLGARG